MAAFSSRGPTDDLRIKPDVVAPGTNVLSMLSSVYDGDGEPLWGRLPEGHPLRETLLLERRHQHGDPARRRARRRWCASTSSSRAIWQDGRRPSGALLKAFLVNGAVPIPGQFAGEVPQGPNAVSGFGRVDVARSVGSNPAHRTRFADAPDDAVATGEIRTLPIEAADPDLPLKITLVWTDAPSPGGLGGLVNELYLQLVTPSGQAINWDANPVTRVTNNVQQITVAAPKEGVYTIRVRGISVTEHSPGAAPTGGLRQDFAVVASNAIAEADGKAAIATLTAANRP